LTQVPHVGWLVDAVAWSFTEHAHLHIDPCTYLD